MQRVKISYTIDLEEIPKKISNFLNESKNILKHILDKDLVEAETNLTTKENVIKTLQNIEDIRQSMISIDFRLEESYGILLGYQKALLELKSSSFEKQTPQTPPESDEENA